MRVRTAGGGRGALGHTPLERRVELNKRYKEKVEKLWAAGCWVACPPRRNWKSCWIASTGWLCARLSLGFPVSRLIAVDMMEDGEIEER